MFKYGIPETPSREEAAQFWGVHPDALVDCPECDSDGFFEYIVRPGREWMYGFEPDYEYELCKRCDATGRLPYFLLTEAERKRLACETWGVDEEELLPCAVCGGEGGSPINDSEWPPEETAKCHTCYGAGFIAPPEIVETVKRRWATKSEPQDDLPF